MLDTSCGAVFGATLRRNHLLYCNSKSPLTTITAHIFFSSTSVVVRIPILRHQLLVPTTCLHHGLALQVVTRRLGRQWSYSRSAPFSCYIEICLLQAKQKSRSKHAVDKANGIPAQEVGDTANENHHAPVSVLKNRRRRRGRQVGLNVAGAL